MSERLTEKEIAAEKPVCADLTSFRAGVRAAERIYQPTRRVRAGRPDSEGSESAIRILRELEERERKEAEAATAWTFGDWLLAFLTGATVLIGIAGVLFSVSTK